jgi:hypothetical protein
MDRFVAPGSRHDALKRRIQISNSKKICVRVLAARIAPEVCISFTLLRKRRAQGKPDADCTRGRAHE